MSTVTHVLVYGRDASLLGIRRQVLCLGGFSVETIVQLEQFPLTRAWVFGIFVLCHTLTQGEQQEAIAFAQKANPALQTVVMTTFVPEFDVASTSHVFSTFEGSKALVDLIGKIAKIAAVA
jgi:hypothetical protein